MLIAADADCVVLHSPGSRPGSKRSRASRRASHGSASSRAAEAERRPFPRALHGVLPRPQRSPAVAGTFSTKREADQAWQGADWPAPQGPGRRSRSRPPEVRGYVEQTWLPHHQIEVSTREAYTYSINKHLMPEFGPMRMIDILPEHVRAWISKLKDQGVTPATIRSNKIILSAIFTTAMDDQVTFLHPCEGSVLPRCRSSHFTSSHPNSST